MEISSIPHTTHYHNRDRQQETTSEKVTVTVTGGNSSQLFRQQMSSSTMTIQQATVLDHDQLLPDLQLGQTQGQQAQAPQSPTTTIPISRGSDPINNPYPTTFVTADTSSFKKVVQMLTGSDSASNSPKQKPKPPATSKISTNYLDHHYPTTTTTTTSSSTPLSPSSSSSKLNFSIPPIRTVQNKKQQQQQQQQSHHHHHHHHHHHQGGGFKLYERRNSLLKSSLMISPLTAPNNLFPYHHHHHHHHHQQKTTEILSPSVLDFPSLTLSSPVTPLSSEDEERAVIADKGFYFHPSPSPRGDDSEPPQLLSLFPLTSPQLRPSSSSSSSTTSAS